LSGNALIKPLQKGRIDMVALTAYPLITVKHLAASRDFYLAHFAMAVVFEASWVVMLSDRSDGRICLGLMSTDHPSSPPGPEVFDGQGMIMTFQVEAVSGLYARLKKAGVPFVHDLKDEPWGQRRFMTRDPSGILIDVVEQIEPAPRWPKLELAVPSSQIRWRRQPGLRAIESLPVTARGA
jgi:uncharacterized glyoxalase superfamily protein PhnB